MKFGLHTFKCLSSRSSPATYMLFDAGQVLPLRPSVCSSIKLGRGETVYPLWACPALMLFCITAAEASSPWPRKSNAVAWAGAENTEAVLGPYLPCMHLHSPALRHDCSVESLSLKHLGSLNNSLCTELCALPSTWAPRDRCKAI